MLHGRGHECDAIDALLVEARRSRSGCLVIRGEPGVGKTALLGYAVQRARDLRVLSTVGVPAEYGLPFASLHQLLRPVLDRLDAVPRAQADALRSALGLLPAGEPNRFLIALAVLGLLSEVAERQPVLCTVDDAQWLDPESMDALAFVARRLDAEGVVLLLTATEGMAGAGVAAGLPSLTLVGLDRVASDALVIERAGLTPAPQVRAHLWESARGNPLALHELSSVLTADQLRGRAALPADLEMGVALQHTLLSRADGLPEATRSLLLVAAAEGTGDVALTLRAGAVLGVGPQDLEPAELAGIVGVTEAGIAFRHPLMRTAIYQWAPFGRRQAAHRALAGCLGPEDADRRAWHLSAAVVGPDDAVADELERAAARARQRGGHGAASAALERAADLTADQELAGRRQVEAARDAWMAGRGDRARALLDRAAALAAAPETRADVEYLRGVVEAAWGDRRVAFDIQLSGSRPVTPLDPVRAARMLIEAGRTAWQDADLPGLAEVGARLESLPPAPGTPEEFAVSLIVGLGRLARDDMAAAAPLLQAAAARTDLDDPRRLQMAAAAAIFAGDDRTARELLIRAITRARTLGAAVMLPQSLATMTSLEAWQGSFSSAAGYAAEGIGLAGETGQEYLAAQIQAVLAWIAAVQGRTDDCEALAGRAVELGRAHGVRVPLANATWALAVADIGAGRWPEAMARLETVAAANSPHFHPMVALLSAGDLVETACRIERPDLTAETMAKLEAFARPTASDWTLALVARCRALLADEAAAVGFFDRALALYARTGRRMDEARTHLLYGEFLRRSRRRSDARGHLRSAVEVFGQLGAVPWEERARLELRATGQTARKRQVSTLSELTPQQTQIVRLVAEGATNKQVAAQLFLSARTVDYHLRNVFVKLGISSRAELIRLPGVGAPAEG